MGEIPAEFKARASRPRRRVSGMPRFALRFPARMIPVLARAHVEDDEERRAFAAGRRIAAGGRARADFASIVEWKTRGRGRSRPARNTDVEIADALGLAMAARTDRAAVAVLMGLAGVDVPVASAILTATSPARFTIIDFRALWSLGIERRGYSCALPRISWGLPPHRCGCRHQSAHLGPCVMAILEEKSAARWLVRKPSGADRWSAEGRIRAI